MIIKDLYYCVKNIAQYLRQGRHELGLTQHQYTKEVGSSLKRVRELEMLDYVW